ncbi:type II toxin-antitoxin system VapC family toxin [Candidatus Woesearchaeota archaeon]|nr:type II toxin-antitoxin system VapC family toxin [Candidatus Woesearchaeota archaeon]
MAGQIMEKICLDISVCIDLIKRGNDEALSSFSAAEAFLSSMTLFELRLRTRNLEEAELFISAFEILAFDKKAAEEASNIEKDLKERGALIGRQDIFIAATAMVNNCALATLKVKDFSRIKGLKLVKLQE